MTQVSNSCPTTLIVDNLSSFNEVSFSYTITNIVSLGVLKLKDDNEISFSMFENVIDFKYLNKFPCILFKIENVSIILFKNGKMIITGLREESYLNHIKKKILSILRKAHILYSKFDIFIQNLVSMTNLNKRINLELTCILLTNCIYEPEQFPAAIVKNHETGGTFLVFGNSKIICLGVNTVEKLEHSLKELIIQLYDCGLIC